VHEQNLQKLQAITKLGGAKAPAPQLEKPELSVFAPAPDGSDAGSEAKVTSAAAAELRALREEVQLLRAARAEAEQQVAALNAEIVVFRAEAKHNADEDGALSTEPRLAEGAMRVAEVREAEAQTEGEALAPRKKEDEEEEVKVAEKKKQEEAEAAAALKLAEEQRLRQEMQQRAEAAAREAAALRVTLEEQKRAAGAASEDAARKEAELRALRPSEEDRRVMKLSWAVAGWLLAVTLWECFALLPGTYWFTVVLCCLGLVYLNRARAPFDEAWRRVLLAWDLATQMAENAQGGATRRDVSVPDAGKADAAALGKAEEEDDEETEATGRVAARSDESAEQFYAPSLSAATADAIRQQLLLRHERSKSHLGDAVAADSSSSAAADADADRELDKARERAARNLERKAQLRKQRSLAASAVADAGADAALS
jgi:hypothetical protein